MKQLELFPNENLKVYKIKVTYTKTIVDTIFFDVGVDEKDLVRYNYSHYIDKVNAYIDEVIAEEMRYFNTHTNIGYYDWELV